MVPDARIGAVGGGAGAAPPAQALPPALRLTLRPGELLFIPAGWAHHVSSTAHGGRPAWSAPWGTQPTTLSYTGTTAAVQSTWKATLRRAARAGAEHLAVNLWWPHDPAAAVPAAAVRVSDRLRAVRAALRGLGALVSRGDGDGEAPKSEL